MEDQIIDTTTDQGTDPAATKLENQEKTFTQAQLDAIVTDRLSRAKKDMPSADELKSYRDWQAQQKTDAEKNADAISKANQERDEMGSKYAALEKKMAAISKGIPADKAEAYVLLASAKTTDTVPFEKALEAALADFPLVSPGVPGTGGNPPNQDTNRKSRPSGAVIL